MSENLFKTSNSRLCLLICVYIIYLFFGASVFDAIESPHEDKLLREFNQFVKEFRLKHNSCITDEKLNEFIKLISLDSDKGVSASHNVSTDQKWTFGQSVFFAGTVLTTIGYGNVSPLTKGGKLFCILFAIIGIPITLILLSTVIERLMKWTSRCLKYITNKFQPYLSAIVTHRVHASEIRILFAFVCAILVLVFFIIIPAAIYASIEGWTYLNAFYYCFISLSTVGLGDYVPGDKYTQDNRHLYKIISTLYLIIGVTVVVWLLQIFSETPEFNLYKYFTLVEDGQLTNHSSINNNKNNLTDENCRQHETMLQATFQQDTEAVVPIVD